MTAASYYGDGSNLTGIAATNFTTQVVAANSAETIIDLADGNMITMNQSANTTVGFASTSTAMDITLIRKPSADTTITWPDSVKWNGGTAPTLLTGDDSDDSQQFQLLTRDSGLTWYAWEPYSFDAPYRELWGVGYNASGTLGQNNTTDHSSPVQIPGTTWNGSKMGFGAYAAAAIKTDGTLWTWGHGVFGQHGHNNAHGLSSPIQLPGSYSDVSGGYYIMSAVKTDGTLWTM